MAIGNILKIPKKTSINCTLAAKSILVVGASKSGKSTICSQAPRPVFLMTENGAEALTGMVPVPIASWADFKSAVNQLCTKEARETFDTIVIDTYTNLILLLDKYLAPKLSAKQSKEKEELDFGSDADFGGGTKAMKNELGIQLQKLSNQGYLLLNIVHAEQKVDFKTQTPYVGTSLSTSLYGVAEKFVDQIIFLRRDLDKKGNETFNTFFNSKSGFGGFGISGAGGRFTPPVDSVPTSFENIKNALLQGIELAAERQGAEKVSNIVPAITIENDPETMYDFPAMMAEFKVITTQMIEADSESTARIKAIVELELGSGKKVSSLTAKQAELLANILNKLKSLDGQKEENE